MAEAHSIEVFNVPLLAKQSVLQHILLSGDVPVPRRNGYMMRNSLKLSIYANFFLKKVSLKWKQVNIRQVQALMSFNGWDSNTQSINNLLSDRHTEDSLKRKYNTTGRNFSLIYVTVHVKFKFEWNAISLGSVYRSTLQLYIMKCHSI